MKLIPQNSYILCEQIQSNSEFITDNLIQYIQEKVPIYKIIDIDKSINNSFEINDEIICNSIGTKINLEDKFYYLFNEENIIGKVKNDSARN